MTAATVMRMPQAVQVELDDKLTVIPLGEDIGVADGAFKCTEGLLGKFEPCSVIDLPILEAVFPQVEVGAAVAGLKPVVEMMVMEFIGVAPGGLVIVAT